MDIRVSCPQCGAEFEVDASHATPEGLRTTCTVCGESITVEAPAAHTGTGAGVSLTPSPSPPFVSHSVVESHESHEQLLEMMSVAERERREMAWQMTRELLRLREMVEQQQTMVGKLMAELAQHPPPASDPPPDAPPSAADETSTTSTRFEQELDELREALEREREVVERLRRSKLELERRATNAEETLDALRSRGFFDRLLGRDDD